MAHCDVDSTSPPRRRIGAVVLVLTVTRSVLLVKPTYREGWQLPGGGAHEGERIADAAARELKEETSLVREITHLLAVDQVPASADRTAAEGLNVVCDGGTLTAGEAETVAIPESASDELSDIKWIPLDRLGRFTEPYQERRIRQAYAAVQLGSGLPLLDHGHPTGER
ncbi:NUDIX domain-containing protein [Kitasatospora kifunensis]|uniref:ADP-ribose pyrophosphatase YjhB (NUDIX family) n=1 Tax=Kitasatospora kifunensis TaxID=58351 RepID=A0A7W7QYS2_KITKI|nr:NUDIX domain-containing protein [Kitasatospora kifunensis]MBB4922085.1 ADP-ribose pyrophosphatase YjhB (NUDIX family) [Kitasatospora kifunensis]